MDNVSSIIYWNKFFSTKTEEIYTIIQGTNDRNVKELYLRENCEKEILPRVGKILSLKNLVLNYLHFNLKFKTLTLFDTTKKENGEKIESHWSYVNYIFNEEIIRNLNIPKSLMREMEEMNDCLGCMGHGFLFDDDIPKRRFRLCLKPGSYSYDLMEYISRFLVCQDRELWKITRKHGITVESTDVGTMISRIHYFLSKNMHIIRERDLNAPNIEQIKNDILRYDLSSVPKEVWPKGRIIPWEVLLQLN